MDVDLSFGQKNSYNMVVCVSIPVMHKSEFIDFSHLMVLTTNCHFLYVLDNYCNLKLTWKRFANIAVSLIGRSLDVLIVARSRLIQRENSF